MPQQNISSTPFRLIPKSGLDETPVGIWIDSDRIDECMACYRAMGLSHVSLSSFMGYKRGDLRFLRDHPYIKYLSLPEAGNINISEIKVLKHLRYLLLAENQQPIDFNQFPELQELRVEWHRKMVISSECKSLRTLYLRRYRPKSKDLTELADLPWLEELEFVQSPLISINGVERYRGLHRLKLYRLTKLEHIEAISGLKDASLEFLDCDVCRKIKDQEVVSCLRSLRILAFNDCGEIQSIGFLNKMPSLEDFRFVNTNVLDGDLKPCLRLKSCAFFAKKHHSHTPEEVEAAQQAEAK